MRKPDFFIVGAPKSGTTAMADYLGQHPEIFMAKRKDSNFFGSDLRFVNTIMLPPDMFRVNEETYLSWFADVRDEKRVGEASVWYLYSKKAAKEIKEFNPDADIIIMLRNPVDMLYSLHGQFLYDFNEDIEDFEEALGAEEDRKRGLRIPTTAYLPEGLYYREVARFSEQVERYINIFGRDRVLIIIFEEFKEDTKRVYKETLRFLGVSTDFEADFRVVNPAKAVRSRRVMRFIADPPRLLRPLAEKLSTVGWLRDKVKWVLDRFNVKVSSRSPMDRQLRRRLLKEFAPEIERLSKIIGKDLTFWLAE
jgi:hypothetical protein